MKNTLFLLYVLLSLGLNQARACEDNVQAKIQLPGSLKNLSATLTSKAILINGVEYFIAPSNDKWCAQVGTQAPNCDLPKVIFVSANEGKVTSNAEKNTTAAIEFLRLSNSDPVLQLHEVKAPFNTLGFREFKTKGAVKARVYGRQMEDGSGNLTWSMTVDAVKFDTEFGDDGENISEGIEVRHEKSSVYERATTHPSLAKPIQIKPSWEKDWNLNCVEGKFSYDDQEDEEEKEK